jgi:CRISPR-associated protein Cmr6
MNVHYPQYYQGKDFPVDYDSPIPIHFLTVQKTPFSFALGIHALEGEIADYFPGKNASELTQELKNIATEALQNLGIGSKTSLGYGLME